MHANVHNALWSFVYISYPFECIVVSDISACTSRYGGPGSQRVSERFSLGWHTYMASSRRVVYASLDGRGTASRGDLYLFQLYRQLGTLEVEDQLLGVR